MIKAKIRDVVGLYLDPLGNAVVVSAYEKSQVQGPGSDSAEPHGAYAMVSGTDSVRSDDL